MLLDESWLGFWEYWHCEKFVLWAYMNMFMMHVGNFASMCMDKFVGMKFFRLEILAMEKFCWVCDVGSWKIFVVMILAM